jgi:hypothetical protein
MHERRNQLCPCGSGKKYKRCCAQRTSERDRVWARLREAEGRAVDGGRAYAAQRYGADIMELAFADFMLDGGALDDGHDRLILEATLPPWMLFNWVPGAHWVPSAGSPPLPARPLALEYLDQPDTALDDFDRRFVRAVCQRPYSFYAVNGVQPGASLQLRDILTGREFAVLERQASRVAQAGAILFTRVVEMDGVAIMCGGAPAIIPPHYRIRLLELRDDLGADGAPITEEQLLVLDDEIRALYLHIADELYHPRLPELRNTDGDPLVPTTLHFELRCTPQEAFERLRHLSLGGADLDREPSAVFGPDGALHAVRLDWLKLGNKVHASWDNTRMGGIHIDGARLVVDVNSQRRATRIRALIEKQLGERVRFKTLVMDSVQKALEKPTDARDVRAARRADAERARLKALPEVQAHMKDFIARHYAEWLDKRLPALHDRSPREAVQTTGGRERVEALLQELEWMAPTVDPVLVPDLAALRRELGL